MTNSGTPSSSELRRRLLELGVPSSVFELSQVSARVAARLELSSGDATGKSWLGGEPLAMGGQLDWPRGREGEPLRFLLQVDCSSLSAAVCSSSGLPAQGLLTFFLHPEQPPIGLNSEESSLFAVQFEPATEGLELVRAPYPTERARPLCATEILTYNWPMVAEHCESIGLNRERLGEIEMALTDAEFAGQDDDGYLMVVGGHADSEFDSNPSNWLEVLAHGQSLDEGCSEEILRSVMNARGIEPAEWVSVARVLDPEVDSFPLASGSVSFFCREEALLRRDFASCRALSCFS